MKTPTNLNSNNLITFLQTNTEFRMADLFTIALLSGTVLRWTTWDSNLTVAGNVFLTGPPHIKRSHIEEKIGLDVTALDLEITAGVTDLVNGVPLLQLIATGGFDGATLRIDRLFMDCSGQQIGTVLRFSGMIGEVEEVSRTTAKLSVNALVHLLQQPVPSLVLQPNCTNTLFDARCGLSKAGFAASLVVQSGSTVNKVISLSAQPDHFYDNGQILFTSGVNNGLLKAIRQYTGQQFFFNSPLPFVPAAGDTFTAYPGCDKTQQTCTTKFVNLANFEGFPYIPSPETAI